jgi:phosphoribosyl 1,2-cyclic phosphodiesterase
MSLFCPLASGSKGNSLLLGTQSTKVLIDAGLSLKQIEQRLSQLQVDIKEIDAILVTHEHSDHIKGLDVIARQLNIPILANSETARAIYDVHKCCFKFKIFSTGEMFEFGDISFHPFSIQHDTVDPVAFTAHLSGKKIGICADIGFATSLVKAHLKECDYLYIESNHEPSMVYASSRPMVYKQRVLSRQGHLSNQSCAELLKEIYHSELKKIYLAHLSMECNRKELALRYASEALREHLDSVSISIADQENISEPLYF